MRLSLPTGWALVLALVATTALADCMTGTSAWFGPFYLIDICIAAWILGWGAGTATACLCVLASLGVNGFESYPADGSSFASNAAMRIFAVALIVALIANVRKSYEREWQRARRDPLTGILNKQGFLESAKELTAGGGWAMLAFLDLDDLKKINDRHGHLIGDEVLREFTSRVQKVIRTNDLFARIGGDEFLLFVMVNTQEEAHELARILHNRINRLREDLTFPVRCSMGAIILEPGALVVTDAEISAADQLMYEAKREGAGLRIAAAEDVLQRAEEAPPFKSLPDKAFSPPRKPQARAVRAAQA
jgi:diguanylate cyclase (GGDEF)-like protein